MAEELYPYVISISYGIYPINCLELACEYGFTELVRYFLRLRSDCLTSGLYSAIQNGHSKVVSLILEKIHLSDYQLIKSLSLAAFEGYLDIIQMLIPQNYSPNEAILEPACYHLRILEYFLKSPLETALLQRAGIFACQRGLLSALKLLLRTDKQILDYNLLMEASDHGSTWIVDYLLDFELDINFNDDYCLAIAYSRGHMDTIDLLIDRGAQLQNKRIILNYE